MFPEIATNKATDAVCTAQSPAAKGVETLAMKVMTMSRPKISHCHLSHRYFQTSNLTAKK